jgi:hypothetical protein
MYSVGFISKIVSWLARVPPAIKKPTGSNFDYRSSQDYLLWQKLASVLQSRSVTVSFHFETRAENNYDGTAIRLLPVSITAGKAPD